MRYFSACFRLQLGIALRALPGLLAMALAALLLAGGAAAGATALAARGQGATVRIAVAGGEEDPRLEELLTLFEAALAGAGDDTQAPLTLYRVPAAGARAEVRSGRAAAALLLPEGFLNSLMTGENLPPTLVVDTTRPLEAMLVSTLAESAARMLADTQQGIAFTLALRQLAEASDAPVPDTGALVRGINLEYALWAMDRDNMFRTVSVSPAGTLPAAQGIALYAALYLLMLAAPALYRLYALGPQAAWLGRLRGAGRGAAAGALAQLLAGALALLPALALLLGGVGLAGALPLLGGSPGAGIGWGWGLAGLAVTALALACFGWLCCNAGGPLAAGGLAFLAATALLATADGLLPSVLLPAPLAALAPYNPLGWMHAALAPLLGGPAAPGALAALAALVPALGGLCLLAARRRRAAA